MMALATATCAYDELEYHARLLGTYAVDDVLISSSKCVRYARLSHFVIGAYAVDDGIGNSNKWA